MKTHAQNRNEVIFASLKEELFGPSSRGEKLLTFPPPPFENWGEASKPLLDPNGQEILKTRPSQRYGIGVLYPLNEVFDEINIVKEDSESESSQKSENKSISEEAKKSFEKIEEALTRNNKDNEADDFDLASAHVRRPSTMGISFMAKFSPNSKLILEFSGAIYKPFKVSVAGKNKTWWQRHPLKIKFNLDSSNIVEKERKKHIANIVSTSIEGFSALKCELFSRPVEGAKDEIRLVTVYVLNQTTKASIDEGAIFQSHFETYLMEGEKRLPVLPYPRAVRKSPLQEDLSNDLLYRQVSTYAIGHGCSADWKHGEDQSSITLSAEALPTVEIPNTTPDIVGSDGLAIEVPIPPLAGLIDNSNGFEPIEKLIKEYEKWIETQNNTIVSVPVDLQETAKNHILSCYKTLGRIQEGYKFLRDNETAKMAFKLANHAMLIQQVRSDSSRPIRRINFNEELKTLEWSSPYPNIDLIKDSGRRGNWRAFQIAFLLLSLRSSVEDMNIERDDVELIWFPTGGGKTEAYLALASFSMFYRRILDKKDHGVHVLMRYTLRLLTAQQFQRASGLLCAMEHLRKKHVSLLGDDQFSIGLWLGSDITPNTREQAVTAFNKLADNENNPFIIDRCPWCKSQIGVLNQRGMPRAFKVQGYEKSKNKTVTFRCPDRNCEFSKTSLPIYVIDEDLYEFLPTMIIATVDKFAALAWKPSARKLFGLDENGVRTHSPPGLIIQDELHLISGPLGSMVGLYEILVEELCTDRRNNRNVKPKIISSTATIKQYAEQIKNLYCRENVHLFPPPGLSASDSFFSKYSNLPGKQFVGIFAPALGSLQTVQVRTFSSLLQGPTSLSAAEQDPWWTLLMFFNSLRELGTTVSLFQSDIPDHVQQIGKRYNIPFSGRRRINKPLELTSRLSSQDISKAFAALEVKAQDKYPVDACLASNIIEVGVDVDRLSLMTVVGQPKTTSQYIQVTGRVGRDWKNRPGLVVTIYSAGKPRDRSHFEKFRSYHERLYSQVEPTSVTPFSPPVLDRALHAIMVGYVRQNGNPKQSDSPADFPETLLNNLQDILIKRIKAVDEQELPNFVKVFAKRIKEWKLWARLSYNSRNPNDKPLLKSSGSYIPPELRGRCWQTPLSLRNVDATCEAYISHYYIDEELNDE